MIRIKAFVSKLKLVKEANLLDSKFFVLKTFFAITVAFVIGNNIPLVRRDMISVLFGLILTLEAINVTGVKSGWDQIVASFIGATVTGIIILIFGVNAITVGLSVAFTLYICLIIDWKSISPVALFTAIYMTQNLQIGISGQPSILLTVALRFAALVFGVVVAILFNFIFSLLQYKFLTNKRTAYLLKLLLFDLSSTNEYIIKKDKKLCDNTRAKLVETSNSIEWVYSLFSDMNKEFNHNIKIFGFSNNPVKDKLRLVRHIRIISHLLFDINYILGDRISDIDELNEIYSYISDVINKVMDNLGGLKRVYDGVEKSAILEHNWLVLPKRKFGNGYAFRINQNLIDINKNIRIMAEIINDNK
ncbi:FUSC family protein [Helicovermis profundi]|uniref:FUSC family protein n=1 Tax=Helicovermis profundi TaxID=3065157 RepID=A0AAU9E5A4_9FIRM|nr:hypothetical protein HLPR_08140 [Clostridia bacterium S502]